MTSGSSLLRLGVRRQYLVSGLCAAAQVFMTLATLARLSTWGLPATIAWPRRRRRLRTRQNPQTVTL